jgi:hypothetical protein
VVPADPAAARLASRDSLTLATDLRNAELKRSVLGASALVRETLTNLTMLKRAVDETPNADTSLIRRVRTVEQKLLDMREELSGDPTVARRNENSPPSLLERLGKLGDAWGGTLEPATASQLGQVDIVRGEFGRILAQLRQLYENDFQGLQAAAERAGVPWTSGRMPSLPYVP